MGQTNVWMDWFKLHRKNIKIYGATKVKTSRKTN